ILLNVLLRLLPTSLTVVRITTEMPAAMSPYSMAVAPDSSPTNRENRLCIASSLDPRGCLKHRPEDVVSLAPSERRANIANSSCINVNPIDAFQPIDIGCFRG